MYMNTTQDIATNADITALYNQYVSFIDASAATTKAYTGNVRQFIKYLYAHNIHQPTRETVIAYRDELKARCSAATVQNYIESLRIFFAWTEAEHLYPNIANRVKGATISKTPKKDYLTAEQAAAVLSSIDRDTVQGVRDYAMILVSIIGGLRVIEIHRANIEDFDKEGSTAVLLIQGKGRDDKGDFVKLPTAAADALKAYLKTRTELSKGEPLFTSVSHNSAGERLSTRSISGIIKARLKAAGYDSSRLTAHSLRHSAVTIALQAGNSIQEVQAFARHKSILTTQIYAHNIDRENSKCEESIENRIFERRSPSCKPLP